MTTDRSILTTTPVAPIDIGPPDTTATISRLAAGAPITITWPGTDTPLRSFLLKVLAWAESPHVTVGELYNLVYGAQNPLLVPRDDGTAIVTREAFSDPAFALMGEIIDRKRAGVGHLDLDAARARFTVPVTEAALALEMTPGAVRQLIHAGRLSGRKEGDSWLLDPASVEAYRGLRRGPKMGTTPAAEVAIHTADTFALTEPEKAVLREVQHGYRGIATICAEARFNSKVSLTFEQARTILEGLAARGMVEAEPAQKAQWRRTLTDAPEAVHVRVGHLDGHHVRIVGATIHQPEMGNAGGAKTMEGPLCPGWERLHVLSYDAKGSARYFVFEPTPGAEMDWRYGDFYIRGAARMVGAPVNNARQARAKFERVAKQFRQDQ